MTRESKCSRSGFGAGARSVKLASLCVLVAVAGCRQKNQTSSLRSFLGLEAGQNASVRDGGAPTFVALSDWFQGFSVTSDAGSTAATAGALTVSAVKAKVPSAYQANLLTYIDAQEARLSLIEKALAAKDDDQLGNLLELETRELYDIIMVILNKQYMPTTQDEFAILLHGASRSDYVSVFALDFLANVLKTRLLTDIEASLEDERQNYLKSLTTLYLGNDQNKAKLAADTANDLRLLQQMRALLAGSPNGALGLAGDGTAAANSTLTGNAAAFMAFHASAPDYVDQVSGLPSDMFPPAGTPKENPDSGTQAGTSLASGTSTTTLSGTSATYGSSANQSLLAQILPTLSGGGGGASLTNQPAQDLKTIIPHAPSIDCTKMNLSGRSLVDCQLHFAYAQTILPHASTATASAVAPGGGPASLALDGSTGTANIQTLACAHTPTIDQGPEPSCTAHALSYAANAYLASDAGADSGARCDRLASPTDATALALVGTGSADACDPEAIWTAQGQQPTLEAAIAAMQGGACASQNVVLANVTTPDSFANIDKQIMAQIDAGGLVYLGVNLSQDWTANGGGNEFNLDDTTQPILGCDLSGPGHALIATGYKHINGRLVVIVHNSWGGTWGDKGYALMDIDSCELGADIYFPTFKKAR